MNKQNKRERQEKLFRLFDGNGYEEFHTPKYVFVKHWNGDSEVWQVAIYTTESFKRFNAYQQTDEYRNSQHLRSIQLEL